MDAFPSIDVHLGRIDVVDVGSAGPWRVAAIKITGRVCKKRFQDGCKSFALDGPFRCSRRDRSGRRRQPEENRASGDFGPTGDYRPDPQRTGWRVSIELLGP